MPDDLQQGVAFRAPPGSTLRERMPDWGALWVLLELSRSGSFRACERRLRKTVSSIRRDIAGLEAVLGLRLLTRHPDGIRLTAEGERVVETAARMEADLLEFLRARPPQAATLSGCVRVAVTEGLGAAWLAPRLVEFQQRYPDLRIDLACAMTSADVLRMEADVAVQLTRPQAADVKATRLGHLHVMPYASRGYLVRHGTPATVAELASHRLAIQLAEQTSTVEILNRIFAETPFVGSVPITNNVSSAHTLAIANGAGIGWLPTYTSAVGVGLIPIECGAAVRLDIWMTFHPDVEAIPRVRHVIDWLRASFDPRRFPFFAEARVPPAELPMVDSVVPLRDVYRGLAAAGGKVVAQPEPPGWDDG